MFLNITVIYTVLVLFAGLAVNFGMLIYRQTQLQTAAEAAAVAGSIALQRSGTLSPAPSATQVAQNISNAANGIATLNGFTNGANGVTIAVENPPTSGSLSGNAYAVRVTIQQPMGLGFLSLLHLTTITAQGQSTHGVQPVNLSQYYNVDAIAMDGAYIAATGGLDAQGGAYSAKLMSTVRNQNPTLYNAPGLLSWRGNIFTQNTASAATTPASSPNGNTFCASENGTCTIPSPYSAMVYFGANGSYTYRVMSGSFPCTGSYGTFGEPAYGYTKSCYYYIMPEFNGIQGSPPTNPIYCGPEYGTCTVPAGNTATVYFGVNGQFNTLAGQTGNVNCSTSVFGDPDYGLVKSCYYSLTTTMNGQSSLAISLPNAVYSQIQILAGNAWGLQGVSETFVVTYQDNSTSSYTIKMTDWWCYDASHSPPEQTVFQSPYMVVGGGSLSTGGTSSPYSAPVCAYGYTLNVDGTKALKYLNIPPSGAPYTSNTRPVVLAVDLMF